MANTAQTLSYDELLATTMQAYRPTMEDNITSGNPLFYWLTQAGKKKTQDGGANIIVPLMYALNSTARSYSNYDVLDVTPQNNATVAIYPWRQLSASISINRMEERKNSGKSRVLSLLESKIMNAELSLKEEIDRQAFLDGTGNGSLDIFGLALLVENGAAWLSNVASIDRTAETWWRNQYTTATGVSFATGGLGLMRTVYNNASKGNIHPDLIVTTQTVFQYYEGILAANERFLDMKSGDAGFQNLLFKGAVMMYDTYCQAQTMYFLTSDYLEWMVDSQTDFITTPFVRPANQDARVAQILTYANLTCSNCARQGHLGVIDTA